LKSNNTSKSANTLRWIARIIGLFVTLVIISVMRMENIRIIFMRLPKGPPNMPVHLPVTPQMITSIVFALLVLAAYVKSWWKERRGGILFIIVSFVGTAIILISMLASVTHPPTTVSGWFSGFLGPLLFLWLMFGLPPLICGLLFLKAASLTKRDEAMAEA
jgi:hypothetical protein